MNELLIIYGNFLGDDILKKYETPWREIISMYKWTKIEPHCVSSLPGRV